MWPEISSVLFFLFLGVFRTLSGYAASDSVGFSGGREAVSLKIQVSTCSLLLPAELLPAAWARLPQGLLPKVSLSQLEHSHTSSALKIPHLSQNCEILFHPSPLNLMYLKKTLGGTL